MGFSNRPVSLAMNAARCGMVVLLAAGAARAQNPDYRLVPDRGIVPGQAYRMNDIESVNMSTGGLTLRIPLAQLPPGPGGLTGGAMLTYNSKYWQSLTLIQSVAYHHLQGDENGGGWNLRFGYVLERVDPDTFTSNDPCVGGGSLDIVQLRLVEPDGSEHRLYWKSAPEMPTGCEPGTYRRSDINTATEQTWFTIDGSFLRLRIPPLAAGQSWPDADWTLYRPDGSRVEFTNPEGGTSQTKLIDRNGNFLTWSKRAGEAGDPCETMDVLANEMGHEIQIAHCPGDKEEIRQVINGRQMRATVQYSWVSFAGLTYKLNTQGTTYTSPCQNVPSLATSVTLPRPYGANGQPDPSFPELKFQFEYNARYRELSRVTMPSGAIVDYQWALDPNPNSVFYYSILANGLTQKTVTYRTGTANGTQKSEVTTYSFPESIGIRSISSATGPDKGTTSYEFHQVNYRDSADSYSGKITKVTKPDGSAQSTIWASNSQYRLPGVAQTRSNHYVSWEYEETPAAPVRLVKTRKHEVDKNGNETAAEERGWQAMASGAPASPESVGTLLRRVETPMVSATSAATATATLEANGYVELTGARVLGLASEKTVKEGLVTVVESARFVYDSVATGNVLQESVLIEGAWPAGRAGTTVFTYDSRGRLTSRSDEDSVAVTYNYNGCGGKTLSSEVVSSVGTTSHNVDCTTGLLASVTNANGRTDSFLYDEWGRLKERNLGGLSKTSWKYNDQAQWILERTDVEAFGDGKATAVAYFDQLGRERRKRALETHVADDTTAASETGVAIVADTVEGVVGSAGSERWVRKVSNPYRWEVGSGTDGWTATVLDRVGRVCAVEAYQGQTEPSAGTCLTAGTGHGGRTAFSYGTAGADTLAAGLTVTEAIQGVPVQTRVRRSDGLGRLVRVEEASGTAIAASTDYFYDAADRLVSVDQGDRDRSFVYLLSGWLKEATNPENGLAQYEYTDAGRLVKKTSPAGRVVCMGTLSGPVCTKSFDGAGRPLKKSYSDGTSTVDYVYAGTRLSQVTNGAAVVSYGHDALDRVTARTQKRDAGHAGWTFTAAYRPAGLATEAYPSGRVVSYAVDAVGRVTGVTGSKGGTPTSYLAAASYAPHGGMATATIGGQVETRSWNGRLQPVGISRGTGFSLNYSYCAGQAAWCGDNNGNVASQVIGQASATQSYEYDAFGRLTRAWEGSSWNRPYGLDRYGNHWVLNTWTGIGPASFTPVGSSNFNAKNQLVIQGSHYDLDGQQDVIGGYGFAYDGEGRLATSTLNGVTTTNDYDGEGRRVKKAVIGETTSRVVEYVYGVDGELAAEYDTQASSVSGATYPAQDHLGSTRVVFDSAGVAKVCLDYLPYGEPVPQGVGARTGQCWAAGEEPRQRFTGKEREFELSSAAMPGGLDCFGARYLSGAQGRFSSPDPFNILMEAEDQDDFDAYIGNPQNWNKYVYTWNNPLRYVDPNGERVYVVAYTTGNANGDEEFKKVAETLARQIQNSKGFDSKKDTVVVRGVGSKDDFKGVLADANKLEKQFGKVEAVSLVSHGGPTDGPTFARPDASGTRQFMGGERELRGLSVNWAQSGQANFYGCNTAVAFCQRFANAQGVPAWGFDNYSSFSGDANSKSKWYLLNPWNRDLYMVGRDGRGKVRRDPTRTGR